MSYLKFVLLLFFTIFVFEACNLDSVTHAENGHNNLIKTHTTVSTGKVTRTENKYTDSMKRGLESLIMNCYKVNGHYFLVRCNKWLIKSPNKGNTTEYKLTIGDQLSGLPDHHVHSTYFVKGFENDSIIFDYKKSHNFGGNNDVDTGNFKIGCSGNKEKITNLTLYEDIINAETALKHISENRIYLITESMQGRMPHGIQEESECVRKANAELGFQNYYFAQCIPSEVNNLQIKNYNAVIFDYLIKEKGLDFRDIYTLKREHHNFISNCQMEKRQQGK